MVKVTAKYIFRKISKKNQIQRKKKDETDLDYLNKLTHLYLDSQFIDKIASIPQCQSISVVYLQNNLLQSIHNMDNFPKLTHLYLQHNYIRKMENLNNLSCLKKLYLGNNEISVVEGLERLTQLTELHLENQRLPDGCSLYFDPRTVRALGKSLKVLNVAKNNLASSYCLEGLTRLSALIVDDNKISDLEGFTKTLSGLPVLESLSSEGNPINGDRKYFDSVIFASKSLKTLNGKPIKGKTKIFVTNFQQIKEYRKQNSFDGSSVDGNFYYRFNSEDLNSKAVPQTGPNLTPSIKKILEKDQISGNSTNFPQNVVSSTFENSIKVSQLFNSASFPF